MIEVGYCTMATKKSSKKAEIYLPLREYEWIMQEVEAYKELQKKLGIGWVKVKVNVPEKAKARKKA